MPLSVVFSALLLAHAPAQAPGQSLAQMFQAPMTVAEPVRLALTPILDGTISPEEWDPIASSPALQAYFQWEPGKLHFAGTTANGNDLLVSIDFGSNGWLVGEDNVEIRVSNSTGTPTFTIREMDGTQVSGPRWLDLPGMTMASKAAAKSDGVNTTYEFTLDDAGLGLCPMLPHSRLSLRLDAISSSAPPVDPFLPRVLSPVQLEFVRSAALPNGLKFAVENAGVFVPPGEGTRLRFTFNGNDKMNLQRLSLRGEGFARSLTEIAVPFPTFDAKGRALSDYNTSIPRDAKQGFRIVRATLLGGDGLSAVMEASFRISPVVDISLVRMPIRSKPQDQTIRLAYYVKSNSGHRLSGQSSATTASPLSLTKPDSDKFSIDGPRNYARMGFDLLVPGGTRGVFPLTIKVNIEGQKIDAVGYINVR